MKDLRFSLNPSFDIKQIRVVWSNVKSWSQLINCGEKLEGPQIVSTCVIPTSNPSLNLPIDQAHCNYWLQWNNCSLKEEGSTNLKPSFSRQV